MDANENRQTVRKVTSGNITVVRDESHNATEILVNGTDLLHIIRLLTSQPLVGTKLALPDRVFNLATQVFDAIDVFTRQGLDRSLVVGASDRFFQYFTPLCAVYFTV